MVARRLTMSTENDDHLNTLGVTYLQIVCRAAIGRCNFEVLVTASQSDQPIITYASGVVECPAYS